MKPPETANVLENVPTITSTSFATSNMATVPCPFGPVTPVPCASSTMRRASWRTQASAMRSRRATSPVME